MREMDERKTREQVVYDKIVAMAKEFPKLRPFTLGVESTLFVAIAQMVRRIEDLEKRQTGLSYEGTHVDGETYLKGAAVTHGGSLWIAKRRTSEAPGSDDSWQLAVKRGRNGRDAR